MSKYISTYCFKGYDQNKDALKIDENNVATIGTYILDTCYMYHFVYYMKLLL